MAVLHTNLPAAGLRLGCLLFCLAALLPAAAFANPEGGRLYQERGCVACHGAGGNAPIGGLTPKLGGQPQEYLLQQLQDFKSLKRDSAASEVMWSFAQSVSEQEMRLIAEYLSIQP